jgi:hypothetical protein
MRLKPYSSGSSRRAAMSAYALSSIILSLAFVRPGRGFFARFCAHSNFAQFMFFGSSRMPDNLSQNIMRDNVARAGA